MKQKLFMFLILIALFSIVLPQKAYAYLDPGSESYIVQFILGTLLAAAVGIAAFWKQITTWVTRKTHKKKR